MANESPRMKAEVVAAKSARLEAEAQQLDLDIRRELECVTKSLTSLAAMLARMRDERLWQFLPGFRRFEDYVRHVLGDVARGKIFELLAIHELTEGRNSIPAEVVERMGFKKAAELARLEPQDRTPDLVKAALVDTVPRIRQKVQEKAQRATATRATQRTTRVAGAQLARAGH